MVLRGSLGWVSGCLVISNDCIGLIMLCAVPALNMLTAGKVGVPSITTWLVGESRCWVCLEPLLLTSSSDAQLVVHKVDWGILELLSLCVTFLVHVSFSSGRTQLLADFQKDL